MFNKLLNYFRNTDFTDNYDNKMAVMKETVEINFIGGITNHRKVKDYDNHVDKILKGYDFINNFIHRGIQTQVKAIKGE